MAAEHVVEQKLCRQRILCASNQHMRYEAMNDGSDEYTLFKRGLIYMFNRMSSYFIHSVCILFMRRLILRIVTYLLHVYDVFGVYWLHFISLCYFVTQAFSSFFLVHARPFVT